MYKEFRKGFTLIELIIVIVIISFIAAMAIPRFINQTAAASQNSTNAIAGALSAMMADNYAKRSANSANGVAVANCTTGGSLLQTGLPTGYTITSAGISAGATVTCTLTGLNSTTATFVGIGIS